MGRVAIEEPLPTIQLSAPERRVIMTRVPVVESGLAFGGPAHGHYIPIHGRHPGDVTRWLVRSSLAEVMRQPMSAMQAYAAQPVCPYRLCLYRAFNRELLIWIPNNVPHGEEMLHIFKLALGGSVF
jgi:hypothetical protein